MKIISKLILFALVLIVACKPTQETSTETLETEDIMPFFIISSGGGFTGKYDYYKINQSGEILKLDEISKQYLKQKSIDVKQANEIFNELNSLRLWEIDYNVPGNMTYSIEIMKEGQMHVVKWADGDQKIDPKIQEFFSNTMRKILK